MSISTKGGAKFNVKRCDVEHVETVKFEHYDFPTVVVLALEDGSTSNNMKEEAEEALKAKFSAMKIINSDYGNPYECYFLGDLKVNVIQEKGEDMVEIKTQGWADRRYDIDGSGHKVQAKKEKTPDEKRAQREETKRIKASLPGYRLTNSAYSSSKCSTCGEAISTGARIAKLEKSTEKGGWSHVECLLDNKPGKKAKSKDETDEEKGKNTTKKRKRGEDQNGDEDEEEEDNMDADDGEKTTKKRGGKKAVAKTTKATKATKAGGKKAPATKASGKKPAKKKARME
jgi:hypothetical protein